jgi:hypothetical protein
MAIETFEGGEPFDPDAPGVDYGAVETELNNRPRDPSPVIVGNESNTGYHSTMVPYNDNSADQKKVDAAITSADAIREVTWRNENDNQGTTLGTNHYPVILAAEDQYNDIRRLVTPANGKWTINPLQYGANDTTGVQRNSPTAEDNTRLISLSMGDFSGKDIEIRFGGYNTGSGANRLRNGTKYYNSLLMFDFTDNSGSTEDNPYVEYYHNNDFDNGVSHLWHPQKWRSMTMYTQYTTNSTVNGGVDARLVFGPYGHKYHQYIDYWNWGRYTGNPWYGQQEGDMNKAFPGNDTNSVASRTRKGMAYMPEYFGNDLRMFFLDGTNKNVLIIQGVNILGTDQKHSVIYSRRGVELGGGLVKSSIAYNDYLGATTRHVNTHIDGMSYGTAPVYPNYFGITARYSQIIYNTDIVLRSAPGAQGAASPGAPAATRESFIHDATLPDDGVYGDKTGSLPNAVNRFADNETKRFSPTVKIIGGYIYIGERHKLTISGGRTNTLDGQNEETLTVSPASITIASGGALRIKASSGPGATTKPVVTTDIFAGGALTLDSGARTIGNIIIASSGAVTMADTPDAIGAPGATRHAGDIYIESGGALTIGRNAVLTGDIQVAHGAELTIEHGATITGDVRCAGKLRLRGSITINYDPAANPARPADNPDTADIDESQTEHGRYIYHGIFIMNPSDGSGAGELETTGAPAVSGDSGRIHSFVAHSGLTGAAAAGVFCSDHAVSGNICDHWTSAASVWLKQGDTNG